ncbi:hypothetical protein N7U49_02870 [Streptomyces sp. AD2-2]|nr:hypothetical protein N7U49_02870 [Streptomyces sp. AD2-2]
MTPILVAGVPSWLLSRSSRAGAAGPGFWAQVQVWREGRFADEPALASGGPQGECQQ